MRLFNFKTQDFVKEDVTDHLHAPASASCATTDKHEQQQNSPAKVIPAIEVGRPVARGREDGNHLKQSVARGVAK